VYGFSVLKGIISVARSDITSYFSSLYVYCGDNYITLEVSDCQLTSYDCYLAACTLCWQDSRNKESMDAGLSFSSPLMILSTPKV